jgi:hypothetical protein
MPCMLELQVEDGDASSNIPAALPGSMRQSLNSYAKSSAHRPRHALSTK